MKKLISEKKLIIESGCGILKQRLGCVSKLQTLLAGMAALGATGALIMSQGLFAGSAWALDGAIPNSSGESQPLEEQLKALDVKNQAPASVSKEKLYAVQTRNLPLANKSEVSFGGGYNLTPDNFVNSQQLEFGYRYHFNNRWSLGTQYATVANKISPAGEQLRSKGVIPDVPYAKNRTDLTLGYNLFYGKFRLSVDRAFNFDQYVALGPGIMQTNSGSTVAVVGDVGLALWLGRWGSTRIGLKDYYYQENYRSGSVANHNLHAHLDVGYLF